MSASLPPAAALVDCGHARHRIVWEAGTLHAADHADPDGERTLAALGGPRCTCVDVLDAWARQREAPGLLAALSRGPADPLAPRVRTSGWFGYAPPNTTLYAGRTYRASGAAGWPSASGAPAPPGPATDLALLAGLGPAVGARLVAAVTTALLASGDGAHRPALEASLYGRAVAAARVWSGDPALDVDVRPAAGTEVVAATLTDADADADRPTPLLLVLPPGWVAEVWGRGLAVVAGRLALAVLDADAGRVRLATVGTDLGPPAPVVVELDG